MFDTPVACSRQGWELIHRWLKFILLQNTLLLQVFPVVAEVTLSVAVKLCNLCMQKGVCVTGALTLPGVGCTVLGAL